MSPRLAPIKRDEFILRLRALGFEWPVAGGKHRIMLYGQKRLAIPSDAEYSVDLHARMLREVREVIGRPISRQEWELLSGRRPGTRG
jgi:hypothetical protein